jgi:acyl-CoA reductase-like NAD-dependent aldehyde dehydrogenase
LRVERLAETASAMKVADGFELGAMIGPLIDRKAVEKVEAHIADAVKRVPRWSSAASGPPRATASSSQWY